MSNNNTHIVYRGPGFCTLLFLVFLVLKLMGYISWSWWWITAPLWIPIFIAAAIFLMILVIVAFDYTRRF